MFRGDIVDGDGLSFARWRWKCICVPMGWRIGVMEAMASAGCCVGEATAASAYVAGDGKVAATAGSASTELEGLEQAEPSFIQLCTL